MFICLFLCLNMLTMILLWTLLNVNIIVTLFWLNMSSWFYQFPYILLFLYYHNREIPDIITVAVKDTPVEEESEEIYEKHVFVEPEQLQYYKSVRVVELDVLSCTKAIKRLYSGWCVCLFVSCTYLCNILYVVVNVLGYWYWLYIHFYYPNFSVHLFHRLYVCSYSYLVCFTFLCFRFISTSKECSRRLGYWLQVESKYDHECEVIDRLVLSISVQWF